MQIDSIFNKIISMLNEKSIEYKHIQHAETFTSEQSAIARGESIEIGAKALVLKIDDNFKILVLSAAKKLDSKKVKEYFNAKKIRFASSDELMELTGLVPGSIPPFGNPIFDIPLFIDESILQNEKVAFNAGSLTNSLILKTTDYTSLAIGNSCQFTLS
jgi:Ala-tRNA(Pro) deacylase